MIKKMIAYAVVSLMLLGGAVSSAQTLGFSGGVTGHGWWGSVWAQWLRANGVNNRAVVYANGRTTEKAYANRWNDAKANANRKISGNTAYWHYY